MKTVNIAYEILRKPDDLSLSMNVGQVPVTAEWRVQENTLVFRENQKQYIFQDLPQEVLDKLKEGILLFEFSPIGIARIRELKHG